MVQSLQINLGANPPLLRYFIPLNSILASLFKIEIIGHDLSGLLGIVDNPDEGLQQVLLPVVKDDPEKAVVKPHYGAYGINAYAPDKLLYEFHTV